MLQIRLSRARARALPRSLGAALIALAAASPLSAAELVRGVRYKLSAGDLRSGEADAEEYRRQKGVDAEYLNAVGWLARGAEMLGRRDKASAYVAELRREIPVEKPELVVPLGAAIEIEGKLRLAAEGRGAAILYLEGELGRAKDVALRARIRKNLNLLTLEGQKAPELGGEELSSGAKLRLASLAGKPALLFFWAQGCGDCKAEAAKLGRLAAKYVPQGLAVIAPTRLYGTDAEGKEAAPAAEKALIAKVWSETYTGLANVPVVLDTETMVRYGVSATPTYALVDREGTVRLYTPTRVTEAELATRIEALLK